MSRQSKRCSAIRGHRGLRARYSNDSSLLRLAPAGLALRASRGAWRLPPHLALLQRSLMEVAAGRLRRLVVTMPPRHGKSLLISQYFPAWYLGHFPHKRVLLASYGAEFAATWGRRTRDLLAEHGPELFGVRPRSDCRSASHWTLESTPLSLWKNEVAAARFGAAGGMTTAGVGGPITGKGADLLLIDDPVKNAEQANSATYRERTWDWFTSTAYTRLEPNGAVIVVQTRWHEGDLAGRLLDPKARFDPPWQVLRLAAVAESDDPLGRREGDALWPARFPAEALARIRATIGSYWWSALYQQRPAPAEGTIFQKRHFRYWWPEGQLLMLEGRPFARESFAGFATVDLAISKKSSADFTVLAGWLLASTGELVLIDLARERFSAGEILPAIQRMVARNRLDYVAIEKSGFQDVIVQQARRAGLSVRGLVPRGDKVSRAHAASARFEAEMVYFPKGSAWLEAFERELLSFPASDHDDQVDVVSYACLEAHRRMGGRVRREEFLDAQVESPDLVDNRRWGEDEEWE